MMALAGIFKSHLIIILFTGILSVPSFCVADTGLPLADKSWHPSAIGFTVVLYYLTEPNEDPSKKAAKLASEKYGFQIADKLDKTARTKALINLTSTRKVSQEFPPPSIELLHYFGRGLTADQAQLLQKAPRVLALGFAYPSGQKLTALKKAEELILTLARQGNVVIWDDETREAFTSESWSLRRLESWQGQLPDVSKHTIIHAYNNDGNTRAISLGMSRFGFPDLVIEKSVWSLNNALGNTVNIIGQQLVEGVEPDSNGFFRINIHSIRHEIVRKRIQDTVIKSGTGQGMLQLVETKPEQGDPENILVALNFAPTSNQEFTISQVNFVSTVFGSMPDDLLYTKHDADLLAASARAKAQLPNLRAIFNKGLQPGEQILVKAPFLTSDGGKEWMWVEIISWTNDSLRGMLRSDPRFTPNLKAGQTVDVKQSELFDYIRRYPDGHEDGNETTAILMARQKK